jgi:hypothetical protein
MTRREDLSAVGLFDLRFRTAADVDLWLRLAGWGPVGVIDEPLHRYRISSWQWSAQARTMRSDLADFLLVLDDYLNRSEVKKLVTSDSLATYEMERSADHVLVAMYSLAGGRTFGAEAHLKEGLAIRHFLTALRRPRKFARLSIEVGLRMRTWLRLGKAAGRGLYQASQWGLWRKRQPR